MRILRWAGRFWTGVLVVAVALAGLLLGLRLALPLFDAPPSLRDAIPAEGAEGVAARARPTLRFDRPMNPRSVERALQFSPPIAWVPAWSDNNTTLTISPTEVLRPETAYSLTVSQQALSRRFRALASPIAVHFRTAQPPAVLIALPADNAADVALDSPISIRFSRTIVPERALMQATTLPELLFDPPLAGSAIWLDSATVLFRPDSPLRPGTRYRATLAATLADVNGGQLSGPFSWGFSTAAPQVLAISPPDSARLVGPRATIVLTASQPLALESLRASLTFSPAIAGQLAAQDLPDGRQRITYQPDADLQPGTTYSATLQAGVAPVAGNLPLLQPLRWSFTTAPHPALTGRFPGEGQTLPNGQEIRLVFNTPMDSETFRAALQLAPPVETLDVTSSDSEIHINANLRAATEYTMTLPATLTDRNGIALGQEYRIRFLTAPSGPRLELPELAGHLAQIAPGSPARLLMRRTNLSELNADLYRLDESALVRTLGFQENEWSTFQPERYNQALLRSWRIPLSDQLNTAVEERLELTLDQNQPLTEGAYYLRLRSLEGPRADVLLLVARTRLSLQTNGSDVLIWATDTISATPAISLPVALYRAGVLVRQGSTGADGTLRFDGLAPGAPAYIAVAAAPSLGVGSAPGGDAQDTQRRIFVSTDRSAYQPGEVVRLAGFVRAAGAPTGTLALPPADPVDVSIHHAASSDQLFQAALRLNATGVFSTAIPLAADSAPGQYTLSAMVDGVSRNVDFTIRPAASALLQVAVDAPPLLLAGATAPLSMTVRTLEGLPVAGATVSWTLDVERAPFSVGDDLTFGDDERSLSGVTQRSGAGQTDSNGQLLLAFSDLQAGDVPLRYRLVAWAAEAGGLSSAGSGSFVVVPTQRIAGVRLPSRIFTVGKAGAVELLTLSADGQPAARTTVRVEVYRRTWVRSNDSAIGATQNFTPTDRLTFTRSATTGADGVASLPLVLPAGGVYRLRASVAGSAGEPVYSAVTIWATTLGFTNWGELPADQPRLIADRPAYRPGDTATLLVITPLAQSTALISRSGASGYAGEVRTLRAGSTFTLTVQPDDAPELPVCVLLAARKPSAAGALADLAPLPIAEAKLPVISDRQVLDVGIAADRASYAPGATATVTVTTRAAGTGVPADIILSLTGAESAPENQIADGLASGAPAHSQTPDARVNAQGAPAVPELPTASSAGPFVAWSAAQRTDSSGVLTFTLQMPRRPAKLRATAWAASPDRFGQAQDMLVVTQPIGLRLLAPPALRAGDEVELAAYVQNFGPDTQSIESDLAAAGLALQPNSAPKQRVDLSPGATARLVWRARVLDADSARITVKASAASGASEEVELSQPILPLVAERAPHDGGIALLHEYLDPSTGQALDPARLRAGQLVRVRLTVISAAAHGALTIEEPLPAGALLIATGPSDMARIERGQGHITLEPPAGAPGIQQYSYLIRLVAGGNYDVPAPSARAADGASGVGNTIVIDVAGQ